MSEWVIAIWFVSVGLFGHDGGGPSAADTMMCHLRVAVVGDAAPGATCPCGDVCDEDVKDEDVKDEDVKDEDACDGCDPDDDEERDDDERDEP